MLTELRRISAATSAENPYLGRAAIDALEREIRFDSARPPLTIQQQISRQAVLGFHRLRVGENDKAIADLKQAYELWKKHPAAVPSELGSQVLQMLAVAFLRVGETENCIHCETGENCIFPLQRQAVHVRPEGSRHARKYLLEMHQREPADLGTKWLLNVVAMTLGEYPDSLPADAQISADRFRSAESFPRFRNRAPELNLDTLSLSGGVIVDDFNNDDLLDIVVSDCHPDGQLRFFRNTGDGIFREYTQEAGLTGITGGLNLLQADFDNNGSLDILLLRGAWLGPFGRQPNSLLSNDGQGRFRDVTFEAGLGIQHFPTQTAGWSDFDLDGDLDLYVGNENDPCQLFVNDGRGHFDEIAAAAGVTNDRFTKGVVWGDYDSDGDPDLYVSNLNGPNRLYQNLGDGRFRDVAQELGVQKPLASFPVFFWDYNNDGHLDLSVFSFNADISDVAADYLKLASTAESDAHYEGDGKGGFVNRVADLKLDRVTHPMGANFGDWDNDGFLDFYLGTGDIPFQMIVPNLAFRNQQGNTFVDITESSGLGHLQKGHGIAFADLDRDGDQDTIIELGGAFLADTARNAVFENTTPAAERNNWLNVRLVGVTSNRSAIGARIRAVVEENGSERSVYRWVNSGGSFGCNPLSQHIGLASSRTVKRLEIDWPASGIQQQFFGISAGQSLEIREDSKTFRTLPSQPVPLTASADE
ncbi:MAG: CRTAC1 family protein [Fuerstiella sp.]